MKRSSLTEGETVRNKYPDRKVGDIYIIVTMTEATAAGFPRIEAPTGRNLIADQMIKTAQEYAKPCRIVGMVVLDVEADVNIGNRKRKRLQTITVAGTVIMP